MLDFFPRPAYFRGAPAALSRVRIVTGRAVPYLYSVVNVHFFFGIFSSLQLKSPIEPFGDLSCIC